MLITKACGSLRIVKRFMSWMQIHLQANAMSPLATMHEVLRLPKLQVKSGSETRQAKFIVLPSRALSRLQRLWLASTRLIAFRILWARAKWHQEITRGMLKCGTQQPRRSSSLMDTTKTLSMQSARPMKLYMRVSLTTITSLFVT